MNIIVKLSVEIPEETIAEFAKRVAEEIVNDDENIVQVVRCKDCKWFNYSRPNFCHFFGAFLGGMKEDDYCSRGERRNDA